MVQVWMKRSWLLAAVVTLCCTSAVHAQRRARVHAPRAAVAPERGSYTLEAGVVVDRAAQSAYVMARTNEVHALDLRTGRTRWHSSAGIMPLGVTDAGVLALREVASGELRMVVLDENSGRERLRCDAIALPGVGTVSPDAALGYSIEISMTRAEGAVAVVHYEAHRSYAGGAPPSPEMEAAATSNIVGDVAVDVQTGHRVDPIPSALPTGTANDPAQHESWPGLAAPMTVGPFTVQGIDITAAAQATQGGGESMQITRRRHADQQELSGLHTDSPYLFAMFSNDRENLIYTTHENDGHLPATVHVYNLITGNDSPRVRIMDFFPYCVVASGHLMHLANDALYGDAVGAGARRWVHPIRVTRYQGPYPP